MAVDVCEAEVAALEAVGELGVIESKEVHDGGVEVVDVDVDARRSRLVLLEMHSAHSSVLCLDAAIQQQDAATLAST